MTSNAGAQYARQASIGFNSQVTAGEAMLKQVKKTFKPDVYKRQGQACLPIALSGNTYTTFTSLFMAALLTNTVSTRAACKDVYKRQLQYLPHALWDDSSKEYRRCYL